MAEQSGHATTGKSQVDVQFEAGVGAAEAQAQAVHLRPSPAGGAGPNRGARRTTKENATMPPASQWAWAYSIAST